MVRNPTNGFQSQRSFGVCSLFGVSHGEDRIGPNGLPLAPASIRMLGRFQLLRSLAHKNLIGYVDFIRGKSDRCFIITEHWNVDLSEHISSFDARVDAAFVVDCVRQICDGIHYLHARNIIAARLGLQTILVSSVEPLQVHLSSYGLYRLTNHGREVDFPLYLPHYAAPELICATKSANVCSMASDIWALGICLFEMLTGARLDEIWKPRQFFGVIVTLLQRDANQSALEYMLGAVKLIKPSITLDCSANLREILTECLWVLPSKRPTISKIRKMLLVPNRQLVCDNPVLDHPLRDLSNVFHYTPMNVTLRLLSASELIEHSKTNTRWRDDPLSQRPIHEIYFLWRLVGSSVETYLYKCGLIKRTAPITSLPNVVVGECEFFGNDVTRQHHADLHIIPLPMKHLYEKISEIPLHAFIMSLELRYNNTTKIEMPIDHNIDAVRTLSAGVKEKSIEYQLHRMILFRRLIDAYPHKLDWLKLEANTDIPPLYRSFIWACLLNLKNNCRFVYDAIDTITPTQTDRQLEVDIPRCHQYDELLCSPTAHAKLKRVLKAWIITHPQYVYWQGQDSLAAPFLYLHFNNEDLAFACLTNFIERYMHDLFLKENAPVLQEYLAVFSYMIAFHDPELHLHLENIEFRPDLYAISWFLTMFAHILPLHKLFLLWDSLLLRDSGYPLCVGVAVLMQVRDRLMHFGFNECILLFSDFPAIDIERCVGDALRFYARTPRSVLYRAHAPPCDNQHKPMPESTPHDLLLDLQPQTLDQVRNQPCARLSLRDFLKLTEENVDSSDDVDRSQLSILTVDVRPIEQFHRFALPQSVNIPHNSVANIDVPGAEPELPSGTGTDLLQRVRDNAIIAIVAGGECPKHLVHKFAAMLVRLGFSRVCLLSDVIETVRRCQFIDARDL